MTDTHQSFTSQLSWKPDMSSVKIPTFSHIILCGMGGSHLGAGVHKVLNPGIDIYVHRSYDLPPFSVDFLKKGLCIASSYSGNTEEVLSFYDSARAQGLKLLVVTSGGALLSKAENDGVDVIRLPQGFPPRNALGFFVKALACVLNQADLIQALEESTVDLKKIDMLATRLASQLHNKIPVIYSSVSRVHLAYIWKIKCNETAKIPAFYNCLPELNHNEMEGFERHEHTRALSEQFSFVFLSDTEDHPRILKRMNILADLYKEKGLPVEIVSFDGLSRVSHIVSSIELIDATAKKLAEAYGVNPDETPIIEKFKQQLL